MESNIARTATKKAIRSHWQIVGTLWVKEESSEEEEEELVACDWQRDGNLMFFSFQLPVNVAQVFMGSGMAAFDPIRWTCLWLLPFHLQYFSIGIQCSTAGRIETQRLCLICQYYFKTWPGEEQHRVTTKNMFITPRLRCLLRNCRWTKVDVCLLLGHNSDFLLQLQHRSCEMDGIRIRINDSFV